MPSQKEILFVSHDANRAGAQIFLYNVMEHLQNMGYKIILLFVNDWGTYREEFEEKFITYSVNNPPKTVLDRFIKGSNTTLNHIKSRHNIDLIYVNSIASIHLIEDLKITLGAPVVSHIHELSYSIQQYKEVPNAIQLLFEFSDKIVACSQAVKDNLAKYGDPETIEVIHSFVNNDRILSIHKESNREEILKEFDLDPDYTWVCACGNADWRKAPDIFVQIAKQVSTPNIRFAWIGIDKENPLFGQLVYDVEKLGIENKIAWIKPTPKSVELINAMDYFLLCSREDPFPLVMLEAALCLKPIFCFKNTGGGDEFVENDAGFRAEYLDSAKIAHYISSVSQEEAKEMGAIAQAKVLENYSFDKSMVKIEDLIQSLL